MIITHLFQLLDHYGAKQCSVDGDDDDDLADRWKMTTRLVLVP